MEEIQAPGGLAAWPGSRRRSIATAAALSLFFAAQAAAAAPDPAPAGANDFSCKPTAQHPEPLVLVHGLGATQGENWGYMSPRLKAAGYCVFSLTYGRDARLDALPLPYSPGGVIPMEESSRELKAFVAKVLKATGAKKVDIVGHSEGTVMPRWYLEKRGGAKFVKRFVALTPLWRGTEIGGTADLRDVAPPSGLPARSSARSPRSAPPARSSCAVPTSSTS